MKTKLTHLGTVLQVGAVLFGGLSAHVQAEQQGNAPAGQEAPQAESATYMVKGATLTVQLIPERREILAGEPIFVTLAVVNHSNKKLQLVVGEENNPDPTSPARFRFRAECADGTMIQLPPPRLNGGFSGDWLSGPNDLLPGKPHLTRRFLPDELPPLEPGHYVLHCRKQLEIFAPTQDGGWGTKAKPDLVETEATAPLTVLPPDSKRMGEVINRLGQAAAADSITDGRVMEQAEYAMRSLAVIRDPRTVRWHVQALGVRDAGRKQAALAALAKYNSPVAFAAMKSALNTQGRDIANCTTAALASESAETVRQEAARALGESPFSRALPFLRTLRHDRNDTIRLFVVQAAGRNRTPTDFALLREMQRDPNKMVRDEATLLLNHPPLILRRN